MNEELVEKLILSGAVEVSGIDSETGNFLYNFTDKIFQVVPALKEAVLNDFQKELMLFWTLGLINMDVTQDNPIITLTPLSFEQSAIERLTEDQRITLAYIKTILFL
jgi:hypothetical protein|tara:strand:- start:173 stop:493 length:321 start_codon:yes stop_codon:yes gene_type:complete